MALPDLTCSHSSSRFVAIALVAALALVTLYYGGAAFNKGASEANAAKLLLQGQQLAGAADLYRADFGRWPNSLADTVTLNYLKAVPVALAPSDGGVLPLAQAADEAWTMPTAGQPTFVLTAAADVATCRALNQKSYGKDGILTQAYSA